MTRAADSREFGIEPGDIFACFGADPVSQLISWKTSLLSWPFAPRGLRLSPSHVAIACPRFHPFSDHCFWFESTTLTRRECLEAGRPVSGVQVHHVGDRLTDYCHEGRVDLYRLTPMNVLSADSILELRGDLVSWFISHGVSYDMAGAVFSATRIARTFDKFTGWMIPCHESVFCSQLIAALLMGLCRMNRDNPQRYNPGRLLRTLVQQGTYSRIRTFTADDLEEIRDL